jgi:tetratricopeptide (TPR) repeat protein
MKKVFLLSIFCAALTFGHTQDFNFKYGATPDDSIKCLEQLSAFQLYYNQKSYAEALNYWQYVVNNCPRSWNGVFAYAQNMFDNLIKTEKDSIRRGQLVDSLLWSYDMGTKYFPDKFTKGYALGFKALNTVRYRNQAYLQVDDWKNYLQVYDWFVESVELEKSKTQPVIWNVFYQTSENITKIKGDTNIVIETYERATSYIDDAINNAFQGYDKAMANFDNLNEAWEKSQSGELENPISEAEYNQRAKVLSADTARQMKLVSNYRKTLNNIELGFLPYASCEKLEAVYTKKFETSKDNIPALNKMVNTLSKRGCMLLPVFRDALEIVHQNAPTAKTAFLTGTLMLQDRSTLDKAIEYLNEAIQLYETNEQKIEPYYMLGMAYQLKDNYSEARSAALNAIRINPNCGKAYILIGNLYRDSGARCGGGDNLPYANNWAAADKYAKAAAVDPSVAEEAQKARSGLRFPSATEKFDRGLNAGDSYRVGCWIQEGTTVR